MSSASSLLSLLPSSDSRKLRAHPLQRIATTRWGTNDLNTDKGEVGGSSPPRPTIKITPVNTRRFSLSPLSGLSLKKPFCQPFVNFTIGRMARWHYTQGVKPLRVKPERLA